MAINPVVAQHLQEARRELVKQRDALDHDIAQLDAMLGGSGVSAVATIVATPSTPSRGPAPAMKDAIKEFLLTEDRDFSTNEVAVALHEKYGWELSSTRSQIAKMGKSGEVFYVRRGVYRAMTPELALLAENSSGPDESGPEGDVTTTGPGGDSHAQADRDHGDDSFERVLHRDDRGGASVGGPTS
ncbi:hypothetical protein [Pimelobacter simplex]|uniref:hypothetical protein n=1 Tax=Nocardioides simplex TaxID=2045 RepID=UPI003AB01C36